MTRYVTRLIETKVQVLNPDNTPATGATVTAIIRGIDDSVFDTIVMTEVANGIYTVAWTPDASGHWTVECLSGSPMFRHTFEYFVVKPYNLDSGGPSSIGAFSLLDNDLEQTLFQENPQANTTYRNTYIACFEGNDLPLQSSLTFRTYIYDDGTWKLMDVKRFPEDYPAGVLVVVFAPPPIGESAAIKITVQSDAAQGSALNVNRYVSLDIRSGYNGAAYLSQPDTDEES